MADTNVPSNLRVKRWEDKFFSEYIRGNKLARYMGTDENAIVQVKENLTKNSGDTIYFELVNRLQGAGKVDNQTLEGFEEDLSQRSFPMTVHLYRHAVVVPEYEQQTTEIDLLNAARAGLKAWSTEHTRDRFIRALMKKQDLSPRDTGGSAGVPLSYVTTNATALNAWMADNSDRVLFGALNSNYSAGVFSTALGTVDSSNDKLSAAIVSLAKAKAKSANPKIRPYIVNDDEEWYIMLANSLAFRDLKADTTIISERQYAADRGKNNPLFTDGDIIHDGVIVREIPELSSNFWLAQGTSSIDVGENYLLGAQALGIAFAQRWNTRNQVKDYGTKKGVAIQQIYEVDKLIFGKGSTDTANRADNGVLTVFTSAVANA